MDWNNTEKKTLSPGLKPTGTLTEHGQRLLERLNIRLTRSGKETNVGEIEKLIEEGNIEKLTSFIKSDSYKKLKESSETVISQQEESLCFKLGLLRLEQDAVADNVISYEDICDYVAASQAILKDALDSKKRIVLVTGHRNPDTDSVISAIFEAYRLSYEDCREGVVYLPFVQAEIMPAEIAKLLGEDIYPNLIYETDIDFARLLKSDRIRIVCVDHSFQADFADYIIGVTDHRLSDNDIKVPHIIQKVGSAAALIALKLIGCGYNFDKNTARILYGAMLMDTENRTLGKMTEQDRLVMDFMKKKSETEEDEALYSELMMQLVSETDIGTLYYRDYKAYEDFGVSVIKVYDFIDKECFPRKIKKFSEMAAVNNKENHFSLTLVKLVEYEKGGLKVRKERLYYIFNGNDAAFKKAVLEFTSVYASAMEKDAVVTCEENYIEITGSGKQLSRKTLAPAICSFVKKYREITKDEKQNADNSDIEVLQMDNYIICRRKGEKAYELVCNLIF